MRIRRPVTVLALSLLAGVTLVGCRTSPSVAAYVGDERITVEELQAAVDDRRDDPQVTAGEEPDYTRAVLGRLLRTEVFDAAAEHFGVSVDPGALPDLLGDLLAGQGTPEAFVEQQAGLGYSRADVLERVRQIALLQAIAVAEGAAEEPTEASLRALYDDAVTRRPAEVLLGYVNVADQATADAVAAELEADPDRYAEIVAPYTEQATLPQLRPVAVADLPTELPPALAQQVAATPPGSVFVTPVEELDGLLVVVVQESPPPPFEEVRSQLEVQALSQATDAGARILAEFEDGLDIDVNPRYGTVEEGAVVEADGGVVRLLGAGS